MAKPVAVIDQLPEAKKRKIIDALLSGATQTQLASQLGVSKQAVSRYARKVIRPAVALAHARSTASEQELTKAESMGLTKETVRLSPVADRIQTLWNQSQQGIAEANAGKDLSALAMLINQGHKNVELLGKLTGEFTQDQSAGPGLTIQIVMPSAKASVTSEGYHAEAYHGPVIDAHPVEDNGDEYVIAVVPR